jgi:hypothetical protein
MLPDDDQIRQRAYEIWEREGRPEGREADHWRMAAEEISAQRANTDTQEVPAMRVRGPAQLDQTPSQPSGVGASSPQPRPADGGNISAAPSPDPQSDPLGLAQPAAKAAPRKRRSAGRGTRRTGPDATSPLDADTEVPDRTR